MKLLRRTAACSLSLLALAFPAYCQSQTAPATPSDAQKPAVNLSIPIPGNYKLKAEIDTKTADLLGVMKDMLGGLSAQTFIDSIKASELEKEKLEGSANTKAKKKSKPDTKEPDDNLPPEIANLSMSDVFHNINHVHIVVLEAPKPVTHLNLKANTTAKVAAPVSKSLIAPLLPGEVSATPLVTAVDPKIALQFYESAFHNEGGHRIVWTDLDEGRFLIVGFDTPRSNATVVDAGGYVIVMRCDGYLDLKPLNALMSVITHEAAKTIKPGSED